MASTSSSDASTDSIQVLPVHQASPGLPSEDFQLFDSSDLNHEDHAARNRESLRSRSPSPELEPPVDALSDTASEDHMRTTMSFDRVVQQALQGPNDPRRRPLAAYPDKHCPRYLFTAHDRGDNYVNAHFNPHTSSTISVAEGGSLDINTIPAMPTHVFMQSVAARLNIEISEDMVHTIWISCLRTLIAVLDAFEKRSSAVIIVLDTWQLDVDAGMAIIRIPNKEDLLDTMFYVVCGGFGPIRNLEAVALRHCWELPHISMSLQIPAERSEIDLKAAMRAGKTFAARFAPPKRFFIALTCAAAIAPQTGPQNKKLVCKVFAEELREYWDQSEFVHVNNHIDVGGDMPASDSLKHMSVMYTILADHYLQQLTQSGEHTANASRMAAATYWQTAFRGYA